MGNGPERPENDLENPTGWEKVLGRLMEWHEVVRENPPGRSAPTQPNLTPIIDEEENLQEAHESRRDAGKFFHDHLASEVLIFVIGLPAVILERAIDPPDNFNPLATIVITAVAVGLNEGIPILYSKLRRSRN